MKTTRTTDSEQDGEPVRRTRRWFMQCTAMAAAGLTLGCDESSRPGGDGGLPPVDGGRVDGEQGVAIEAGADGPAADAPPRTSGEIASVTVDMSTLKNTCPGNGLAAPGSDNWPVTWADDNHQYTSWGDGGGFGGDNNLGRVSFGVGRIEGDFGDFSGFNVHGGHAAENANTLPAGKSKGIICIGGTLYLWRSGDGSDASGYNIEELYRSTDHGASWSPVGNPAVCWKKSDSPPKGFSNLTFCQYGKDYTAIPQHALDAKGDPYVYIYGFEEQAGDWNVQTPGEMSLMRVPAAEIESRAAYEWFAGPVGADSWTADRTQRKPVFVDSQNGLMRLSVIYAIPIQRYVMICQQVNRFKDQGGRMGWYQAERPWGPFTPIGQQPVDPWSFGSGGSLNTGTKSVFWNLSAKWMGTQVVDNALAFTMVYTGPGADEFGAVSGKLALK
jgi:hypothetical protein